MKRGAMSATGVLVMSLGLAALAADFNADWRPDPFIFRGPGGLWAIRGITRCYFGREWRRAITSNGWRRSASSAGIHSLLWWG